MIKTVVSSDGYPMKIHTCPTIDASSGAYALESGLGKWWLYNGETAVNSNVKHCPYCGEYLGGN